MDFAQIRKEKGFSQQSLADKIGVTQTTVAMWETGNSVPSMKNLLKLSTTLNVGFSELVNSFKKNSADRNQGA